jgi:leader peptidase (prepilin peptidase)/N-methyltransferase
MEIKMELLELLKELELLQWFIIGFSGLFIGSLLNVFNYRIPHMLMYDNAVLVNNNSKEPSEEVKSILSKYKNFNMFFPASACPTCNHKIKWYENIPVISYLFLLAKCSKCKNSISFEYPFIEILNCVLWLVAFSLYGWTYELIFILVMISIVISEICIDLKYHILPDTGIMVLFLIPLFLSSTGNFPFDTKEILLTSILTYIGMISLVNFWEKIRGFEDDIFGRGDIKYLAALSGWVGFLGFLDVISYACFIGFFVYFILFISKKKDIFEKITPFGPSISIAFLMYYLEVLPKLMEIIIN